MLYDFPTEQRSKNSTEAPSRRDHTLIFGALTKRHDVRDDDRRHNEYTTPSNTLNGAAGEQLNHAISCAADDGPHSEGDECKKNGSSAAGYLRCDTNKRHKNGI